MGWTGGGWFGAYQAGSRGILVTMTTTKILGNSDMALTAVGFGAWAIGGADYAFGWGSQEDTDSIGAIRKAVDLGVNLGGYGGDLWVGAL